MHCYLEESYHHRQITAEDGSVMKKDYIVMMIDASKVPGA